MPPPSWTLVGTASWILQSRRSPELGRWEHYKQRLFFLVLAFLVATVLWALILSTLLSKASSERRTLLSRQDLLKTNASEQKMMLSTLKEDVGACRNCCSGIKAQLQATLAEFKDTQAKLMEQESTLKELQERVTQGLAKAGRDREDIRSELLQALEAVKQQNRSCEQCPTSWLYFQGSCYYFSETQAIWSTAQSYCSVHGAHLAIVKGPDEQGFLSQHTHGRGYWLGLKAVRHLGKIRSYQWVDGVSLTFSHWNSGEPNDSRGHEDCIMMLHSGLWNDAPCTNERDGWICEKRSSC
ncbi:C-type lectin domain family 4 member G isoform X3 [Peromyscus leucopus]|uniref:C-type lectin domain family 4 member G isoform X3 n=1 Tax=Peromyscus leucopus TaxID=10041 RepID=UPI0010A14286|nr:C-type lectin domain family 4 member G isoform X3 [Peromyscus leucopus]